ncbi:CPBP family intramembrane glutamic endopeptidase [Sulfitobacter sp. D35]|uniref:CPBP family intramembrane glutamic endopeptidase n=1 Tax=Sulfitobacter sp. D35 TaxID=3083252 RepID=UPI00296F3940|nr:CPBP family intramembrane glutamic endopeptidase [Sulfitobacter sp. D35]MDW4498292.1 CPBP family intramembrane glutamic endopeptidase [Sulfitobacter sp. D35]
MTPVISAYTAHERLIAPLRDTAQLWRLLLGAIVAMLVYIAGTQFLYRSLFRAWRAQGEPDPLDALVSGATPAAMYALLFGFVFMSLGVLAARLVVHGKGWQSLIGPARATAAQFSRVILVLVVLNAAVWILPPWDWGAPFVPNVDPGRWLMLLPLSLAAILVQTGSEEIVFRGYLQQQLAARFRSPLVWMLLPALAFGAGHYLPEANGNNAGLIAVWALVFGLLMADLTARAGTLGPAIAVHFVNNASAMLIVSLPDELSGLSLYLAPFSADDEAALRAWLPVDFAMMIVSWLAARLAIQR